MDKIERRKILFDFGVFAGAFSIFGLYILLKSCGLITDDHSLVRSGIIELVQLLVVSVMGASFYSSLSGLRPMFLRWLDK